jgi:anti-anti-sigma regulatory factor
MGKQFTPASGMLQLLVPGDLTSTNAEQFRTGALTAIGEIDAQSVNHKWPGVEIDLTAARMVDSAGLNAIISLIRKLNSDGRRTMIHVGDPHVHRICLFTRLDRLAEVIRS